MDTIDSGLAATIACRASAMRFEVSARTSTLPEHNSCDLEIASAVFCGITASRFGMRAGVLAALLEGSQSLSRRPPGSVATDDEYQYGIGRRLLRVFDTPAYNVDCSDNRVRSSSTCAISSRRRGIPCLGCSSEQLDQISRLCCSLGPSGRGSCNGMTLEFFLPASQDCLIGLDLVETPADFRRSLCGHAAMLVEFNWGVGHHHLSLPPSPLRHIWG